MIHYNSWGYILAGLETSLKIIENAKFTKSAQIQKTLMKMIKMGQKFVLPQNGQLTDDVENQIENLIELLDNPKLPYPCVLFEYDVEAESLPLGKDMSFIDNG